MTKNNCVKEGDRSGVLVFWGRSDVPRAEPNGGKKAKPARLGCVLFFWGEGGSWDERRESNEEQTKLDRGIYLASIIFSPPFLSCSLSPIRAKGGTRFSGKGVSKGQNQELIFPPRNTPGPEKGGDERKNG